MLRTVLRWVLAVMMVVVGVLHFVKPEPFVMIVPDYLPWPLALVWISGVFELLGGVGLLIEKTRRAAGYGLIALYVAVFPANVWMATEGIQPPGMELDPVWAWARLPLQAVLIAWAWWACRPDERA
jgi:uncharacterized membrane protein